MLSCGREKSTILNSNGDNFGDNLHYYSALGNAATLRLKTLYTDTLILNQPCDDEIEPRLLWQTLKFKYVAPSRVHDVYELLKAFKNRSVKDES